MKICSQDHTPICFVGSYCPMCGLQKKYNLLHERYVSFKGLVCPNYKKVQEVVFEILCKKFRVSETIITLESKLSADLDLDSIAVVEFFMILQEEFFVDIPLDVPFDTVGEVVNYIAEELDGKI